MPDGSFVQTTEPDTVAAHDHTAQLDGIGRIRPEFYIILVTCDSDAYQTFMDAGWLEFAERAYDEDSGTFGPLDSSTWSAATRTRAENLILNNLGFDLPGEVQNDKHFLVWLLDIGAQRPLVEDESKHN
jgi:hypothetical protein